MSKPSDVAFPLRVAQWGRITWRQENAFWEQVEDSLNALVRVCNEHNLSSLRTLRLQSLQKKCAPLSIADYNDNISQVEDCIVGLIAASVPQGPNPQSWKNMQDGLAPVLARRGAAPLSYSQRDCNVLTIQVFINTLQILYSWAGFYG